MGGVFAAQTPSLGDEAMVVEQADIHELEEAPSDAMAPAVAHTEPKVASPARPSAAWEAAPPGTSSWDAVRAKHEARQMGKHVEAPREAPLADEGATLIEEQPPPPMAQAPAPPVGRTPSPASRKRTNAYGDEVME